MVNLILSLLFTPPQPVNVWFGTTPEALASLLTLITLVELFAIVPANCKLHAKFSAVGGEPHV